MAVRALKAASGTLVVFRMLNVSAWSGEVILPLTSGLMAKPNLNGFVPAPAGRRSR